MRTSVKNLTSTRFVLPFLFVVLYGSGFVGAKLGLPHAGPFEFLALRFGIGAVLLTGIALVLRAPWPQLSIDVLHIGIAGLLMIGVFSAGVFYSLVLGVSPAVSALIIALQPIVVALGAGPVLGERTNRRQWFGLMLGVVGVFLVLYNRLLVSDTYVVGVLLSVVALLGLSAGNLYQKKFCAQMNVFTGGVVQCAASLFAMLVGIWVAGTQGIHWTAEFAVALFWMTVIVSIGAVSILYILIRRQQVSQVASIFYLLPVSAAIVSFFLFGQEIDFLMLVGIAVAGLGVAIVHRGAGGRSTS